MTSRDSVSIETRAADPEARLEREVEALLTKRLLGESQLASTAHIVLGVVAGYLVWISGSPRMGAIWTGAIAGAVVLRLLLHREAFWARSAEGGVRALRIGVFLVALAWGVGGILVAPALDLAELNLILVLFSGLIAGGTMSLLADVPSFQLFTGTMLVPLAAGYWRHGETPSHLVATLLMALFAASMLLFHRRGYEALREHYRTSRRLEVAERKATEERKLLDTLVAGTPSALAVIESNGNVARVNDNFERLFWYTAEEIVGRNVNDVMVPEGELATARELEDRVLGGETVIVETRRKRKDGVILTVRVAAAPVRQGDDQLAFVLYDDVGAQVTAREALRAARDAAETATAAKSAFLANMSHEIRTPMNGVLGMVELLLDTELSPEQRRSVELVGTSGEALMAIINDILDFSKIEAGQLDIEQVEFDLPPVVDSVARLQMARAHQRGLELVSDMRPDVPQRVLGDSTRIRQVIGNLLGNAIKFTHKGEVEISTRLVEEKNSRARIRFAVRDTGIGITPAQQAQIFEPFKQADVSTSRRYGGTGLGLSISRRLVELMGGKLELRSEEGKGSEFSFTLEFPIARELVSAGAPPPRQNLRGTRVLVVDDHSANRRVLSEMLAWSGCAVEEARGSKEGLAALRRAAGSGSPYALLITDVHMPEQDGFDFANAVRQDAAVGKTPIVMLTSGGQPGDGQRCRDLGIAAYLLKPVPRAELIDAAADALSGPTVRSSGMFKASRDAFEGKRPGLRILLAEDNPVNQEVASAMLRKRGHTVDIVSNGVEAVEAAKQVAYDVILMDLQMPEMDGLAATAEIRKLARAVPVIAVTANALSGERERCIAAGMDDYLAKPFKPHDLFAVVEGWGVARGVQQPVATAAGPDASGGVVDVVGLRAELRSAGVEGIASELFSTFRADAPGRLAALREAAAQKDAPAIERAAHAYKSAAGTVRAHGLAALLADAERLAKSGDTGGAAVVVERVTTAHEDVMRVLEKE